MPKWAQSLKSCLVNYRKTLAVNVLCSVLLVVYAIFGALVFLNFEVPFSQRLLVVDVDAKTQCVAANIRHMLDNAAKFNRFANVNIPGNVNMLNVTRYAANRRKRLILPSSTTTTTAQEKRGTLKSINDAARSVDNLFAKNDFHIAFQEDPGERIAPNDDVDVAVLELAQEITWRCATDVRKANERSAWNLKNAFLFSFGVITTLGYGKIEPQTKNGRVFTVIYGFVGVPFTVILLTNFMRYLLNLERAIRKHYYFRRQRKLCQRREREEADEHFKAIRIIGTRPPEKTITDSDHRAQMQRILPCHSGTTTPKSETKKIYSRQKIGDKADLAAVIAALEESDQISMCTLICIVVVYMLFGGFLVWLIVRPSLFHPHSGGQNGLLDFLSGIYYSFIALIHIEYGDLVPESGWWLPVVMSYVCLGLSISAIALRVGSAYVKRLYYYGRKIGNIASVKIRFGAKKLQVRDLLTALGNNIGLEPTILADLDLERLIANAIDVKEGRMERVPQIYMIVDGIWPPELVPLFIKDGGDFPRFVDAEDAPLSERMRGAFGNVWSSFRDSLRARPRNNSGGVGASRWRRHSSACVMSRVAPRDASASRSGDAQSERDANNNKHEPVMRKVENPLAASATLSNRPPAADVYTSDWDGCGYAVLDHGDSLPPSPLTRQSRAAQPRGPPPFLFRKPSVRFHDIIYNNYASNIALNDGQDRDESVFRYSGGNRSIINSTTNTLTNATVIVNPVTSTKSHSEQTRMMERETLNVQLRVPASADTFFVGLFADNDNLGHKRSLLDDILPFIGNNSMLMRTRFGGSEEATQSTASQRPDNVPDYESSGSTGSNRPTESVMPIG